MTRCKGRCVGSGQTRAAWPRAAASLCFHARASFLGFGMTNWVALFEGMFGCNRLNLLQTKVVVLLT